MFENRFVGAERAPRDEIYCKITHEDVAFKSVTFRCG